MRCKNNSDFKSFEKANLFTLFPICMAAQKFIIDIA